MKKRLLITATSLLFAVAASAQWTTPTVSEFVDMAEDGATPQFLYNVGTKMFFAGHNDWNTRASVAEKGDSVRMHKLEADDEGNQYYTFGCYPATYTNKNNWLYVSANDWNAQWVDAPLGDGGYPGTANWIVTKSGDSYKFSNGFICETYELEPAVATFGVAEHVWIKVSDDPENWSNGENTRCYFYNQHSENVVVDDGVNDIDEFAADAFSGAFYDEWKFVSAEAYGAYYEKLVVYAAAQSLKAAIDKAKEENPGINLAIAEAAYNNTSSTLEDLQAAEASIAAAIVDFLKGKATADNPVNFTSKIVNPDFGPDGSEPDLSGWEGTGWGKGGTTWSNAERYGITFDTYQKIGGLPQGVYMVACNGYTRYQNAAADYTAWKAGTPAETKIYFESETNGMFSTPVKHVSAGGTVDFEIGSRTSSTSTTFKDEDGVDHTLYTPNTMARADEYFHSTEYPNLYRNEAYGAIADGDTLKLGIVNSKATGSDWSIFDDFQLFYFGDGEDAYKLWANKAAEANEMEFTNPYGAPEKALYDEAISTLRNATNKDDIMQAIAAFNTITDTVAVSIANYASYISTLNEASEQLDVFEEGGIETDDVLLLTDYLQASASDNDEFEGKFPNGCANYILDLENGALEGKLSAEEILKEIEFVQELIAKCYDGMKAGSNVTGLLTNASFKDGFKGWTSINTNTSWECVEAYEQAVDCYQTVKSKPGVYAISVKAFVRPGGPEAITGDEDPLVYLYMNQFRTPVQNVLNDMIKQEDAVDGVNALVGDGGGVWPNDSKREVVEGDATVNYFFPNSMEGAHYAFTADRYVQTCYGLVGEDGVLKIGLTSDGKALPSGGWCLWADFKLTYMAKDVEALDAVINHYVPEVEALLEKDFGTPEKTKLQEVLTTAQESEDGDAKYAALFELMDAMEAANASIAAYEAAGTALANLETALVTYAETATPAAYEDATNVYNQYADIADYGYGLADVLEITDKLNAAVGKLKLPDYTNTPCDFTQVIENNSFEGDGSGSLNGWQYYVGGDTKAADISDATYTIENADGQYVFNTWSGSAPSEGFWISQTLYGLPAGKYKLEALLASDKGNKITLAANDNAQEFTMENAKEIATDASIIFTLAEEGNVTIKASSGSWFKADNFRLTYGPEEDKLPQDVDGDGKVNITDVVKVINQIAAGGFDATYDVNGDGFINISDVVKIINKIAGIEQ